MNPKEKLELDASERLNNAIKTSDWSDANEKQGYLHGIQERLHLQEYGVNIAKNQGWIAWNLDSSIEKSEWGKVAYWESFSNGWEVANTLCNMIE